jgi:hypothetical protein
MLKPVEEYGAAERILLLTLVEADVATTAQFGVLQPLEREESPFQFSQFSQREGQTCLIWAQTRVWPRGAAAERLGLTQVPVYEPKS